MSEEMEMKNTDKINNEFVHLYLALRRKKENPDLRPLCFRQIIRDVDVDLEILKTRISEHKGVWRIHKTVNKRDCKKAAKLLMHKLIDEPMLCNQIPSLWKTCLMKPEARGERNFLLDIDSRDSSVFMDIINKLRDSGSIPREPYYFYNTPNGCHSIVPPFDIRLLEDFKDVTVIRDGYIFVELYNRELSDSFSERRIKDLGDIIKKVTAYKDQYKNNLFDRSREAGILL